MEEKPHICPMCAKEPTSHSLTKVREMDGNAVYYTSPAKASSLEREGVLKHYDLVLGQNNMPWIWIFDCKDYPISHALDIQTAIELAKLINEKYEKTLIKVIIINSNTLIWGVIKTLSFFVSKEFNDKIHVSDNKYNI
jgi:hypothetical protein